MASAAGRMTSVAHASRSWSDDDNDLLTNFAEVKEVASVGAPTRSDQSSESIPTSCWTRHQGSFRVMSPARVPGSRRPGLAPVRTAERFCRCSQPTGAVA